MFDALLGGKFSGKCKYSIKCIESRLVPIVKKKQAMLRFLRKDVADLLASGHDSNALGRVDALIVEINHASCYDMIAQYCVYILKQLPNLQKQRECPQDAMEAVSTLIFAAARFSDLPELCDLRRVFAERYGSHMESSVNTEFVEKIQKKSFILEKQLCLMEEIAEEYSIKWNAYKFRNKMANSANSSEKSKKDSFMSYGYYEPSQKLRNGRVIDVPHQEMHSMEGGEPMLQKLQSEAKNVRVISNVKRSCAHDSSKKTKKVFSDESENMKPCYNDAVLPLNAKSTDRQNETQKDGYKANEVSTRSRLAESLNDKAAYKAPPYTKSKLSRHGAHAEEKHDDGLPQHRLSRVEEWLDPVGQERQPVISVNLDSDGPINVIPPYVKSKVSSQAPIGHIKQADSSTPGPAGVGYDMPTGGRGNLKDDFFCDGEKPRPKSVRKKHTMLPPVVVDDNAIINNGKHVKEIPSSRRREGDKQTIATHEDDYNEQKFMNQRRRAPPDDELDDAIDYGKLLIRTPSDRRRQRGSSRTFAKHADDCHDDEKIMDRLLMHYSKKGSSGRPSSKTGTASRDSPAYHVATGATVREHKSKNKNNLRLADSLYQRAISLTPEQISAEENFRGPTQAASLQPDLLTPHMEPVRVSLPDYDELAARLRALRKA